LAIELVGIHMTPVVAFPAPLALADMAFTLALLAGGLLLLGGMVSLAVVAYRSLEGEGMRDPREVVPEKTADDDSGLTEGGDDDDWDYY
jgi:hypothetical protein